MRARLVLTSLAAGLSALVLWAPQRTAAAEDYRLDWAIPKGFALEADTAGYTLPTSLALVQHPGSSPTSPIYFVAELGGKIKVVTRDRRVTTFATIRLPKLAEKYPELNAQTGVVGVCLDEVHGYVFATASFFDGAGVLRNHLYRFATGSPTFALRPSGRLDLSQIFAPYESQPNHEMGECAVSGDSLFVSLGEGGIPSRSHDRSDLAGKVVRMTLDGRPHPENPFRGGGGSRYVWALGFRNPFGLEPVGNQLFAAENGNALDSFLRIERGIDYGWDGTDATIAMNADAVIVPSVGPAQLTYFSGDTQALPAAWAHHFFFATSTTSAERGAGVMTLKYDFARRRVLSPPRSFVRFTRPVGGEVAAVGIGPDGLYFAGLAPNRAGETPVYRVSYRPQEHYPVTLQGTDSGISLFVQYGCRECHSLDGLGGNVAPVLDEDELRDRLGKRLASEEYRKRVAALDARTDEPYRSYRSARDRVLGLHGDDQLALWLKYRLLEPRFDDPNAAMPDPGLTPVQAERVANFLLGRERGAAPAGTGRSFFDRFRDAVKTKKFAAGFAAGVILAAAFVGLLGLAIWWRRRRPAT